MALTLNDRLPIPHKNAEIKNVTCEFCIVGCGYKSYKWPLGTEGTYKDNALGIDLSQQQPTFGHWCSERMYTRLQIEMAKNTILWSSPIKRAWSISVKTLFVVV